MLSMPNLERSWPWLVLGLLLALALATRASAAGLVALPVSWQAPPAVANEAAQTSPAQPLPWRVLLPIVSKALSASATVRFGASRLDDQLGESGERFTFGLTTLYYEVTVSGDTDGLLREQWLLNGQVQPGLDRSVSVPSSGGSYISGIAQSTSAPLPAGSYELRLLVGDALIGLGRAEIGP